MRDSLQQVFSSLHGTSTKRIMNVLVACVFLAVGAAAQNTVFEAKPATRTLKADVLRDAPNGCFGSTTCQVYEEGVTWNLVVFCGQATCMKNATGFFEVVEDCGPAPKANDKCQPILPKEPMPFPNCCPKYECLPGATLEYPTEEEIKAEIERARQAQEEARRNAKQDQTAATSQA